MCVYICMYRLHIKYTECNLMLNSHNSSSVPRRDNTQTDFSSFKKDALNFSQVYIENTILMYCARVRIAFLVQIVRNCLMSQLIFYLLENKNSVREEIKFRLKAGNPCYYSVQTLLSSRLLLNNLIIKIYKQLRCQLCCMVVKHG